MKPIALEAVFGKATTMVDGGWRISFDCGEQMSQQVSDLSKLRHEPLYVVVMTAEAYEKAGKKQ